MLSSCPSFEAANVKWWGVQLCQSLGYCMSDSVMLELISILPAGFPKALPIDVKLGGPCKAGTWRRDLLLYACCSCQRCPSNVSTWQCQSPLCLTSSELPHCVPQNHEHQPGSTPPQRFEPQLSRVPPPNF